ncbi:hypothetical protein FACS1894105_04440 [Clostridia bacterium]|nr:hypothetical protein FACS1894105_04440 [Clostridia bacterium]
MQIYTQPYDIRVDSSRSFALNCIRNYLGDDRDIEITAGEHGKPYVVGNYVHFSLSHSGDIIVCAVSDSPVGIDCECAERLADHNMKRIAKRFFTPDEIAYFDNGGSESFAEKRFLEIWTKKEAYAKYTGRGFPDGFGDFSVIGVKFMQCDVGNGYVCYLYTGS